MLDVGRIRDESEAEEVVIGVGGCQAETMFGERRTEQQKQQQQRRHGSS
jgi:hypothetical protein